MRNNIILDKNQYSILINNIADEKDEVINSEN